MSEGVFLEPRNAPNNSLLRAGPLTFGTSGQVVTNKPGQLFQMVAVNGGATAYYIQIFDKATAPVANDIPIWEDKLPASGSWSNSFGLAGMYVANGISFAISTTPGKLTLAAANDATLYTRHTTAG